MLKKSCDKYCQKLHIITIALLIFVVSFELSLSAELTFQPRAFVTTQYTDNVFLARDQNDAEDELITSVSVGFNVSLLGKIKGLDLSYDPEYAFYREFTENDTLRHRASLTAWSQITKNTSIVLQNQFLRTEDPNYSPGNQVIIELPPLIGEDPTVRKGREPYARNVTNIELTTKFGKKDTAKLGYAYGFNRNEDEEIEDNDNQSGTAEIQYWFTPHLGSTIRGGYLRGEYDQSGKVIVVPSDDFDNWYGGLRLTWQVDPHLGTYVDYEYTDRKYDGDTVDYVVHAASTGLDYQFSPDTTMGLRLGYFLQDNEEGDDESGIVVEGNLGTGWEFPRSAINAALSSGYSQDDFGAQNLGFTIYYSAKAAAYYDFTRRWRGDVFGSYRHSEYIETPDDRDDDVYSAGTGLTWNPYQWLYLNLSYRYSRANSSEPENDYTENRAEFRISLVKEPPFRTIF